MLRFPLIAFYFITSIRAENAENFATSRTIDNANKLPLSNRALQECVGTNCPDNDETNKDDDFFDDKKSTKKSVKKSTKKSKKESDDDDDDDDDKKSIKKSVRKSTKKSKKESEDNNDDDGDDKKSTKKSVRKPTKKSKKESVDDDFFESEDYNDDDGDDKKSTKKSVRKPTKKSKKESEDNNDDDGDDKKSTKKSVRKPTKKSKRGNDSDDYIFCGRGIGRQDCQPGQHCSIDTGDRWSYCVKDDSDSDDDHHSDDSDDDHHSDDSDDHHHSDDSDDDHHSDDSDDHHHSDDSDDHHSGDSDDDHHSGAKDEIFTLQVWMDEIVQSTKQMMGISAFVVAGTSSDNSATVQAGKAAVQYNRTAEVEMLDRDMSPDTLIMMSSVSSLITWTALTMLMDGGMFKLDDPINNALPFKVIHKQHGSIPITYRHLYSHSTGLKDVSSDYLLGTECPDDPRMPYPVGLSESLEEVISDRNIWSNSKPGKRHRYSNIATSIGALLVEGHSGVSLQEFTTKYIFEPLQMFSTQWTRPSDGSAAELYTFSKRDFHFTPGAYCLPEWPSEQLWSTAGDMAKFSRSMIKRGDLEYVTQTGADCLYSSQIGNLVYEESGGRDIGLGWYVGGRSYKDGAGNNGLGNGVSAELYINLKLDIAVGFLSNAELREKQYDMLINRLYKSAKAIGPIQNDYSPSNPETCTPTWGGVRDER